MKRVLKLFVHVIALSSSPVLAGSSEGIFYVDPKLAQTVFSESRAETADRDVLWDVGAMVGVAGTQNLVVESDVFRVDYAEQRDYLPVGSLSIGHSVWSLESLSAELALHLSYSSYRDTIVAVSEDGVTVEDNIVLQVLPLGLRHALSHKTLSWHFLEPQFLTEFTQTWVHQSGSIDGIEASKWRTDAGIGVGVVVLESKASSFGGVVISSVVSRTIGDERGRWTHLVGSQLKL